MIVLIASGAYYAMAAQGGSVNIGRPESRTVGLSSISTTTARTTAGPTTRYRAIYFARYIDWFFTTPLLLLDLLLIAAVPVAVAMWIIVADIMMIVIGLFGALSSHGPRWGFYGFACFLEACLGYGLLVPGIRSAFGRGRSLGAVYTGLAIMLFITWWGYPIVWGFAEGSNFISVDAEAACYAGLDIVAKVNFGWFLMLLHPIISRVEAAERQDGKYLPSLMTAPCNAPLYATFISGPGCYPGGTTSTHLDVPTPAAAASTATTTTHDRVFTPNNAPVPDSVTANPAFTGTAGG